MILEVITVGFYNIDNILDSRNDSIPVQIIKIITGFEKYLISYLQKRSQLH